MRRVDREGFRNFLAEKWRYHADARALSGGEYAGSKILPPWGEVARNAREKNYGRWVLAGRNPSIRFWEH